MSYLATAKQGIDLAEVVTSAGVELRQRGRRWWGRCPFHQDRHPSLMVDADRWRCWSCSAHGDAIDWTQRFHGVDFKGALALLGIRPGPITRADRKEIEQRQRRRELRSRFDHWRKENINRLSLLVRSTYTAAKAIKTVDDAVILEPLPAWEHVLEVLTTGTDEDLLPIYREARNERQFDQSA